MCKRMCRRDYGDENRNKDVDVMRLLYSNVFFDKVLTDKVLTDKVLMKELLRYVYEPILSYEIEL